MQGPPRSSLTINRLLLCSALLHSNQSGDPDLGQSKAKGRNSDMAKSLRSKSKQAFRRIKRENPKSDFHMRDQIRTQRLAAKLRQLKPADKDDDNDDEEEYEDVSMDEEEEATAEHQGQTTSSSTDKNGVTTTTTTTTGESPQRSTLLYWILGIMDQDHLTLAASAAENDGPDPSDARILLLQHLSAIMS